MRITVLLVKLKDQYFEAKVAGPRHEALLELGDHIDLAAARKIADKVLAVVSQQKSSTVVNPLPGLAPTGFLDYGLGGTISTPAGGQRVVGIAFTMDDEGRVSTVPQLQDPVAQRQAQIDRLLRRLADGGLGGLTDSATRVTAQHPISRPSRVYEGAYFTHAGPISAGLVSEPWNPPFPMQMTQVAIGLGVAGSGTSTFVLLSGTDTLLATIQIAAGKRLAAPDLDPVFVDATMQLRWVVFVAGAGAENLILQPRYSIA